MYGNAQSVGKIRAGGKACLDYQETGNVTSVGPTTFALDKNAISADQLNLPKKVCTIHVYVLTCV